MGMLSGMVSNVSPGMLFGSVCAARSMTSAVATAELLFLNIELFPSRSLDPISAFSQFIDLCAVGSPNG